MILRKEMGAAAAIALLAVLSVARKEAAASKLTWTVETMADRVIARQESLHRLFVDLYMTTTQGDMSQTDRFAVGFMPDHCFLDFMHLTGPDDPPWRDNVRFQVWLTPQQTMVFAPFNRELSMPKEDLWKRYWVSPYAAAIGWHPKVDVFEDTGNKLFYLDHLFAPQQHLNVVLNDKTEVVESYKCVRVKTHSDGDQLWMAPSLGFAIVKRIAYRSDEGRQIKEVFYCREFKEAAPGLWLPWEIESNELEIVDGVESVFRSYRLDIQELGINDAVPDEVFELSPPPGTIRVDEKGHPVGFEPGGKELLDLWVAVCADVFPLTTQYQLFTKQLVFSVIVALIGLSAVTFLLLDKKNQ